MSSYDQGYQHVLYHAGLSNEKTAAFWSRALGATKNFFGNTTSRISNSFGAMGGAQRQAYIGSRDRLTHRIAGQEKALERMQRAPGFKADGNTQFTRMQTRLDTSKNELGNLKWNRFKEVAPAYATIGTGVVGTGGLGYALAPKPQPWYKEMVQNPMGR